MNNRVSLAVAVGVLALALAAVLVGGEEEPPTAPESGLAVVSDPLEGGRPAAREGLPHVVLVVGCTVRRDQLAMHGGPPDLGAALARFAAEGALFDDAIAAAPWTKPSATALLTGFHALQLGMTEPSPGRNHRRLPRERTTLAERLRAAGYRTVGATANPNLNAAFGFEQGFDAYVQLEKLWREDMRKLGAGELLPAFLAELDALPDDGRPRFLQVVLVDAHAPYQAGPIERARWSEPDLPPRVAAYRAALQSFDRGFATLEAELAARGMHAGNTVFVVVSDHGEGLGWPPHHGKAHGRYLAPSVVGAVWAMRGPGVGHGVRIDGVASGVDLVPTLLGLLDLPGYDGPGIDHSALLATGGRTRRAHAFSDTWFAEVDRAAVYTPDRACQRDFGERPGSGHFEDGCFDRREDPEHARPLRDAGLEDVLLGWREAMQAEAPVGEDVAPSDAVRDQLEALGYLDR